MNPKLRNKLRAKSRLPTNKRQSPPAFEATHYLPIWPGEWASAGLIDSGKSWNMNYKMLRSLTGKRSRQENSPIRLSCSISSIPTVCGGLGTPNAPSLSATVRALFSGQASSGNSKLLADGPWETGTGRRWRHRKGVSALLFFAFMRRYGRVTRWRTRNHGTKLLFKTGGLVFTVL